MDRKNTARGARFLLCFSFNMYLILTQTDQVQLILAFALFFRLWSSPKSLLIEVRDCSYVSIMNGVLLLRFCIDCVLLQRGGEGGKVHKQKA